MYLDDYKTRKNYLEWVKQTFDENDLFVTLNCPSIYNITSFMDFKIKTLEKTVYLRRPSFMYRLVVIVKEPQRHVHMMIKNIPFKHDKYSSFSDLVENHFKSTLKGSTDVDVRNIFDVNGVSGYELLKQRDCFIDDKTLYLPKYN